MTHHRFTPSVGSLTEISLFQTVVSTVELAAKSVGQSASAVAQSTPDRIEQFRPPKHTGWSTGTGRKTVETEVN